MQLGKKGFFLVCTLPVFNFLFILVGCNIPVEMAKRYGHILFLLFICFSFTAGAQTEKELLRQLDTASNDLTEVSLLIDLGNTVMHSDPVRSKSYFDRAGAIARRHNEQAFVFPKLQIINGKGTLAQMKGDYSEALDLYQQAADTAEKILQKSPGDTTYVVGYLALLGNMAALYLHLDKNRIAIKHLKKIIKDYAGYISREKRGLIFNNIGVAYFGIRKYDSALYYYQQALNIFKDLDILSGISMDYSNIAEVYGATGQTRKALEMYQKSYKIKKELNDNYGLINLLLIMAKVNYSAGNYKASIENLQKVLTMDSTNNYLKEKAKAYKILSDNYAALHDFKNAYLRYRDYKTLSDSIFNAESRDKILELQTRFETKQKEKELQILKQKEAHARLMKNLLFAGIIVILLTAFLVLRTIMLKRKSEKQFYEYNKKLKEKENELIKHRLEKSELQARELNIANEYKSRQLTTHALNMMQRNKMLLELIQKIDELQKQANPENKSELQKIRELIKKNLIVKKDWELFKLYFEQVNNDFFDKLIAINGSLNSFDMRHCALIKLNLSVKETAAVLSLSPNSVKSARHRLKKRLNLKPEDDLYAFIRDL